MPNSAWAKKPARLLVLAAAACATVGLAACDAKPAAPLTPSAEPSVRQVTVVGSGKVDGTPDTVTIDASIESIAPDATTAMNQTNDRMTQVIDAVTAQGIDRKDVSTTGVNLSPQYNSNNVITQYSASNSIQVKVRRTDAASPTITAIQTAGGNATRINSVNFLIEDDSTLVKDARARAFNDARDRAEQYAELSELTLGQVVSITEEGATLPPPTPAPRFDATAQAAPVPLEPGTQTVGFTVTVVWELS